MNDAIYQVVTDYTPQIDELRRSIDSIQETQTSTRNDIDALSSIFGVLKEADKGKQSQILKDFDRKFSDLESCISETAYKNKILIEENVNYNIEIIEKKLQIISSNFESLFKNTQKDFNDRIECITEALENIPTSKNVDTIVNSISKEDIKSVIENIEINFKTFYDSTLKVNTLFLDNYNTLFTEVYKHEGNLRQIESDIDLIFEKQTTFNENLTKKVRVHGGIVCNLEKELEFVNEKLKYSEDIIEKQSKTIESLTSKISKLEKIKSNKSEVKDKIQQPKKIESIEKEKITIFGSFKKLFGNVKVNTK